MCAEMVKIDDLGERDCKLLALEASGLTYEEIAPLVGLGSRQAVLQRLKLIQKRCGTHVVKLRNQPRTTAEVGRMLKVPSHKVERLCRSGALTCQQDKKGAPYFLDRSAIQALQRMIGARKKPRRCKVCALSFIPKDPKQVLCGSSACRDASRRWSLLRTYRAGRDSKTFRAWHRVLVSELEGFVIPEEDTKILLKEAMRESGLSKMQLQYLVKTGVLAEFPHPEMEWRSKARRTFSMAQLRVVRRVLDEWERMSEKS